MNQKPEAGSIPVEVTNPEQPINPQVQPETPGPVVEQNIPPVTQEQVVAPPVTKTVEPITQDPEEIELKPEQVSVLMDKNIDSMGLKDLAEYADQVNGIKPTEKK